MTANQSQYHVYKISKNGKASLDGHTNDRHSIGMLVDDLKSRGARGYVFDSSTKTVREQF